MDDILFTAKEEISKIKDNLFAIKERVAMIEEDFDTDTWHRDTKWLMADLNALMAMLHASESLCGDILNSEYFEGEDE